MYYHAHLIRIIVIVAQVSNVTSGPLVCFPVHSNNSVKSYMANYETAMFPRYEYHLELIRKIVDRADPMDDNTIIIVTFQHYPKAQFWYMEERQTLT